MKWEGLGWIYLVKFLAVFRYVVAVQLLWIWFAQLDMLLTRMTLRLLLIVLYSRLDMFLFFNVSDMELQRCGVSISTFHSLWG
jgi:hypothetical protein